jgi:hypothetical protein
MRAVYRQPPERDKNDAQKSLREVWVNDRKTFLVRLERLETAHARCRVAARAQRVARGEVRAEPAQEAVQEAGEDRGEGRALELIEALLAEWEKLEGETHGEDGRADQGA